MPASNKVGTQLLVSPHIKARAQALAIVRQETVAEIYRVALEGGGLGALERGSDALITLTNTLNRMGVDKEAALQAMIDQKIRYADLFLADGSPRARFPGRL